ncbi:uncharacterized protein LOC110716888 [Chenopodium quinoa]|uniref:uncharacterized protein LOC110716888 n=1 Tax=Chenopodium quinoa TaxID=63459 RepID=UPI000B7761E3|nr:uncharacterized protein LOC110716888 [Chenopodium quinoa]
MSNRLKHGIRKPIDKINLNAKSVTVDVTKNITQSLKRPVWRKGMDEEINALVKNHTWNLVPLNTTQNVIGCKWIFHIKTDKDSKIIQYKARYVGTGFNQRPGIDYGETFSPVVKTSTVRLILSLAGLFLSQMKYINDNLCKASMDDAKPVVTPLATHPPLSRHGELLSDPTEYRQLIGSLQYLNLTRLDVAFTVNKLAQYMQRPTNQHMQALHRLLRYLEGTLNMGLIIHKNSPLTLHAYSDPNWASDKDDYISTTAYIVYLGKNPIS